jgi:hypothetical protein
MLNDDLSNWTLADFKKEAARLTERLEHINTMIEAYNKLQYAATSVPFVPPPPQRVSDEYFFNIDDVSNLSTHDAAVAILREAGKPLKTKVLLDMFLQRGKVINAVVPMTSLFSSLTKAVHKKNSGLIYLGDGTWGLKGRD